MCTGSNASPCILPDHPPFVNQTSLYLRIGFITMLPTRWTLSRSARSIHSVPHDRGAVQGLEVARDREVARNRGRPITPGGVDAGSTTSSASTFLAAPISVSMDELLAIVHAKAGPAPANDERYGRLIINDRHGR